MKIYFNINILRIKCQLSSTLPLGTKKHSKHVLCLKIRGKKYRSIDEKTGQINDKKKLPLLETFSYTLKTTFYAEQSNFFYH